MSITASELVYYGSATMPDDDTTTNIGGAIDTTKKIIFTDLSGVGTVEMLSGSTADTTQTVTIYGRDATGTLQSEVQTLNGTSVVSFATNFERLEKIVMSATATGTIIIRQSGGGTTWVTLEPGFTQARKMFYGAVTPLSGSISRYEKIFVKNTDATLALLSAQVVKQSDPTGKYTFGLAGSLNDSGTNGSGNNRTVAPAGITFDNTSKTAGTVPSGSAQGIWLCETLSSSDIATKTSLTLATQGQST